MMGAPFTEIGCRACGNGSTKGGGWRILTDGNGKFQAVCLLCSHISNFELTDRPDEKAVSLRFFL